MWSQIKTTTAFFIEGRKKFTKTGYLKARKNPTLQSRWNAVNNADLKGRVYVVTGASSGLGKEICWYLADKGAERVYMVCRSEEKGMKAKEELVKRILNPGEADSGGDQVVKKRSNWKRKKSKNDKDKDTSGSSSKLEQDDPTTSKADDKTPAEEEEIQQQPRKRSDPNSQLIIIPNTDLSRKSNVDNLISILNQKEPNGIDCLLCNAGNLHNQVTYTPEGLEQTMASHLIFGSYYLSKSLYPLIEKKAGTIVFMSSGGMYNTKFPGWEAIHLYKENKSNKSSYDGQLQYAYAKRAQVLLAERWTEENKK